MPKLTTYDDYRHLPDDGNQYQIIGGELYMTPAPSTAHQRISRNLFRCIDEFVSKHSLGEVLYAPVDVILTMTDVVQPDIVFVAKKRLNIITKKNIVEAPDLVVEVLSEHTKSIDRSAKKDLYERAGVKEYWLADPDKKRIEILILENQKFGNPVLLKSGEALQHSILKGIRINMNEVFGHES